MVDRCVCAEVRFSELLALRAAEGLSLEQLRARTGCCSGCGTCEPYVRLALVTGRAVFPVLSRREADEAMAMNPDGVPGAGGSRAGERPTQG